MKRFKRRKKINFLLIYIILILIEFIWAVNSLGKMISPKLINIVKNNIIYYDNLLVEEYVDTQELRSNLIDDLISLDKNKNEEIMNIDINTAKSYELMAGIVKELKNKSNNYDDVDLYAKNKRGSMVLRYPVGLASSNILLNNLGYRIPLKLELNSNVLTGIKTKVTNYGLNNALIEVYLKVSFVSNVIYFSMDEAINSDYEILLASRMVMGRVPDMFNGYLEKNIESNNVKN